MFPSTCILPQQKQLDFTNLFHLYFLISVSSEQSASSFKVFKNYWYRGLNLNFVGLIIIWPLPTSPSSHLITTSAHITFKQDRLPEQRFASLAGLHAGPSPIIYHSSLSALPGLTHPFRERLFDGSR